jgi:hypothetical protein
MDSTNTVLDILVSLIKGAKSHWSGLQCDYEGQHYTLWGCEYLLNQALRLYQIPDDHYLISEKAKDLWANISTKPIKDFNYQKPVTYEFDRPLKVDRYTGNGNGFTSRDLKKNDTFSYREVFHDDHIVPLKIIIGELMALDNPTYENILLILNKIYICRMVKGEDRALKNKTARANNYLDVIHQLYQQKGMVIYDLVTGKLIE